MEASNKTKDRQSWVPEGLAFQTPIDCQVGMPEDGHWEVERALGVRLCPIHAQREWLLEAKDTFVRPEEFNLVNALARLEKRMKSGGTISVKNRSDASFAECNSSLWSQVDLVLKDEYINEHRYFRIRWKPYWFQDQDVGAWVRASLSETLGFAIEEEKHKRKN